jgi:hypothetical protein
MIVPSDRTATGRCDAETVCLHVPCFQVQVEAGRQLHRQVNACAYHVTEVIEAMKAWAGEQGLADGQLTILAIGPAAAGRQSGATGPQDLRGFAFTTIPLGSAQRRDPEPAG